MSTTVTIELSMQASYSAELSDKNAKLIGGSYADPNEKWADEAEGSLQCAFENAETQITDALLAELPEFITVRINHASADLSLQNWDVDFEGVEVQA